MLYLSLSLSSVSATYFHRRLYFVLSCLLFVQYLRSCMCWAVDGNETVHKNKSEPCMLPDSSTDFLQNSKQNWTYEARNRGLSVCEDSLKLGFNPTT